MNFKPLNRYLLVKPIVNEEEDVQPAVLLPEGYKTTAFQPHTVVRVLSIAPDCREDLRWIHGAKVVVDTSMLQEVSCEGEIFNVVLENYIMGVIE